jgi:hypothetical protein
MQRWRTRTSNWHKALWLRHVSLLLMWHQIMKVSNLLQKTDLQQFLVSSEWLVLMFKLIIVDWFIR